MQMVRQHGIGQAIDAEDGSQKLHPLANPGSPMLERFARELILATQKRPPHTALNRVYHLHFAWIHIFTSCQPGHGDSPAVKLYSAVVLLYPLHMLYRQSHGAPSRLDPRCS
jgi:hypothetical protein